MATKKPVDPLTEALRRWLPALRRDRGWSQDDLASFLQAVGVPWTRGNVLAFEAGQRGLSPAEWFSLLAVLRVGEADLFPVGVELGLGLAGDLGFLAGILQHEETEQDLAEARRWLLEEEDRSARRLADERAAEALGVSLPELRMAARRLWGHSLTKERDLQVAAALDPKAPPNPASLSRMRGRKTVALRKELQAALGGGRTKRGGTKQ